MSSCWLLYQRSTNKLLPSCGRSQNLPSPAWFSCVEWVSMHDEFVWYSRWSAIMLTAVDELRKTNKYGVIDGVFCVRDMFVFRLFVTLMAVDALILQRFSVLSTVGGISFQNIRHQSTRPTGPTQMQNVKFWFLCKIYLLYLDMFSPSHHCNFVYC